MRHRVLSIVLAFVLLLPPVTSRRVVAAEATDYVRARIEKIYDVLGGAGGVGQATCSPLAAEGSHSRPEARPAPSS
jgi:hypothetical protein